MPDPWEASPDGVVEFLRREAPLELERLRSLARVVRSGPEQLRGGAAARDPHRRWLQDTFGIFDDHEDIGGAA